MVISFASELLDNQIGYNWDNRMEWVTTWLKQVIKHYLPEGTMVK